MQKTVLLLALLFSTMATAAEVARCGTDAFGNAVCIDKDGVVNAAPKKATGDRAGGDTKEKAVSAGTADESGGDSGYNDKSVRPRCGTDPFGNTVCR
jgi:hypothetical protein